MRPLLCIPYVLVYGACSASNAQDTPCIISGPATASLPVRASGTCTLERTFTFTHQESSPDFICQRTATELRIFGWTSTPDTLARWELSLGNYSGPGTYILDATSPVGSKFLMSLKAGTAACSTWNGDVWLATTQGTSSCELTITSECGSSLADGGSVRYRIEGRLNCALEWDVTPGASFSVSGSFVLPRCFGD